MSQFVGNPERQVLLHPGPYSTMRLDAKYQLKVIYNTFTLLQISKHVNGVARTLKILRTSKGDYWIKQCDSLQLHLFS